MRVRRPAHGRQRAPVVLRLDRLPAAALDPDAARPGSGLTRGSREAADPRRKTPIDLSVLPGLNATLNATAAVLLMAGYVQIRQKHVARHRACMLAAFAVSGLFLTSYVIYHAGAGSRPFPGQGAARYLYFAVLIPHVVLAAAILPLAIVTLRRGLAGRHAAHVRIARWTLPLWLYVSVTGVIVYWMLYRMY